MNAIVPSLSLFEAVCAVPKEHVRVPRKTVRSWSMDLTSPTVSFPKMTIPKWRGPMTPVQASFFVALSVFMERWATFTWWHVKVFSRAAALNPIIGWILAMTIGYSTTIRNNKLQAIIDAIDAGATGGLNKWYDGSRPATGGTATTLLGTLTFSTTSATKASGVLTFNAITNDSSADATSTVTWGRVTDDAATFCFDHSIAVAAADIIVNVAAIVTGAVLSITSWTITDGNP
jgi:hypothetical protein